VNPAGASTLIVFNVVAGAIVKSTIQVSVSPGYNLWVLDPLKAAVIANPVYISLEVAAVTNYTALLYSLALMNLIILVGVDCLEVLGFFQLVKIKPLLTVADLNAELIEYMYFGELLNLKTSAVFASSLPVASSGST